MKNTVLLAALILTGSLTHFAGEQTTSEEILSNMLSSIEKVKDMTFTLKSWERLDDGKTQYSEIDGKLNTSPLMIYMFNKAEPNVDVEILYNEAMWGDKAYVNAKSWLPNLKLSPFGKQMRKDQHHTILNAGFDFLHGIITNAIDRAKKEGSNPNSPYYGEDFGKFFAYEGDVSWNGIDCYKIVINDPTFTYIDYTVKAGDTVEKLEKDNFICGYLIIDKNDNVKGFESLEAGMKIKLPSSYAKKTILYIDKRLNMPVVQMMHDEVGQYEKYEFHNLKINTGLSSAAFTPDYDGYGF